LFLIVYDIKKDLNIAYFVGEIDKK